MSTQENLDKHLAKLNKNIERQVDIKHVILRGFINGLASAIGATVGVALFFFVLSKVLAGISVVPFIDNILDQIGISTIIEHQLDEIENTPTPTPVNEE